MSTLLLRLASPLQSWGSDSKFEVRQTGREPTKSGVIGMISSALGRKRNEPVEDLSCLKFGIRADREGEIIKDFHIARPQDKKTPYVTRRYYLSDAVFTVGFESEDTDFLKELEYALKHPVYPLFLGRRSCPPTLPVVLGIREKSLADALKTEPFFDKRHEKGRVRIVLDDAENRNIETRIKDVPISFSQKLRQFGYRTTTEDFITICDEITDENKTEHDAFKELED